MAVAEWFSRQAKDWMAGEGCGRWRRVFAGRADQAAPGRKFVAYLLADRACASDAEWVAAEMISNALLHTRSGEPGGWFGIEVARQDLVQIAVRDLGGSRVPNIRDEKRDESWTENGRGLLGIREVATHFGILGSPELGHTVWAQLAAE